MHPATPAQPVTAPALELCPPRRFESALRLVLAHHTNGTRSALMRIGGPAAVERRYAGEAYGNARCMASPMLPGTQWPLTASSHHLLINAGTGTTGTRWLHCILEHLGARSVHNNARMAACTRNCTARWDELDFISDSPIPWQVRMRKLTRGRSAMRHSASDPRADLAATRDAPSARPRHERRPLEPKRCITVPCTAPRGQLLAATCRRSREMGRCRRDTHSARPRGVATGAYRRPPGHADISRSGGACRLHERRTRSADTWRGWASVYPRPGMDTHLLGHTAIPAPATRAHRHVCSRAYSTSTTRSSSASHAIMRTSPSS